MPLAIERACISAEFLPDPMQVTTSLYAALEKRGCRPVRAVQRISAYNMKDPDAAMLGVPPDAPRVDNETQPIDVLE